MVFVPETTLKRLIETRNMNVAVGERLNKTMYGLAVAIAVSMRADCTRRQVGAVIFDRNNRIVGTGYNGSPPGMPGCLTDGACPRGRLTYDQVAAGSSYDTGAGACIALHAEQNALLFSDSYARLGGTIFITDEPCDGCLKQLNGSGLSHVVYLAADGHIETKQLPY